MIVYTNWSMLFLFIIERKGKTIMHEEKAKMRSFLYKNLTITFVKIRRFLTKKCCQLMSID